MRPAHPMTCAALLALALSTGGCCTPGRIGRADSERGLDWTLEQFGRHNRSDWEATRDHVASIPEIVAPSVFENAWDEWRKTCHLYFTGSTK